MNTVNYLGLLRRTEDGSAGRSRAWRPLGFSNCARRNFIHAAIRDAASAAIHQRWRLECSALPTAIPPHDEIERWAAAPLPALMAEAARLRDLGHGQVVSYSRKVFIPLTRLCRDTCR